MKNVIITTTNSIENTTIEKYLGVVTSNLVIGTNFFSDFIASFSDFFGGLSGTYQSKLDELYEMAKSTISRKAQLLGANCILGFKIDFDEVSGKGKSMFMVSVSGTAVKIRFNKENPDIFKTSTVLLEDLDVEIFKDKWLSRSILKLPTHEEWNFILSHNLVELLPYLYECFIYASENNQEHPTIHLFPQLLSAADYRSSVEVVYKDYPKRHNYIYTYISSNNLFSPENIIELLQEGNIDLAIDLLKINKLEYSEDDLAKMKEISSIIGNLPIKGKKTEVKKGLLSSKLEEKYVCPNGHMNDKDEEYCITCGQNIMGLTSDQVYVINAFNDKIAVLDRLLVKKD